jgi:hypothetical protein
MESRVRIRSSVCGHWWAAVVPGRGMLTLPYVLALRTCPCPKCLALALGGKMLDQIRADGRRALFARAA